MFKHLQIHRPTGALRWALALAGAATIAAACQLVTAPPASALAGLERVETYSARDTKPAKLARADCPPGKHVVGGGAQVYDDARRLVRLTRLMPVSGGSIPDGFYARAEAPNLRQDFTWRLAAYAICAPSSELPSYQIVSHSVTSSQTFQAAAARCPNGTVAYGAGADILALGDPSAPAGGQIGLQLNRTSGPLDISRATGRESTAGYAGPWTLTSYAVCAQARNHIHAEGELIPAASGATYCDDLRQKTYGPGGGGGLTDSGAVWLQKIEPTADLVGVNVAMTGTTTPSTIQLVAHQTCADAD
jgi:hypothetical protein